jgi:YcxB-like protein
MRHEATLTYSPDLLKRSVRAFWWRSMRWYVLLVAPAIAFGLGVQVRHGDRGWAVGATATLLGVVCALIVTVYRVHAANSLARFRGMGEPVAQFGADEDDFRFVSGAGSSTLPWSSVTEVWTFDGFWLLLFSKANFVTLPLDPLSAEARAFVLARAAAAGAKIS